MLRCLNPKKAHENRGAPARPVPSGATVALSVASSSVGGEEQVACQYCKYLLEGAILGDCRILRWIGSGAFGDVYEAEQLPPLNRRVAIKVMSIERVVDGESAEMFAREVGTIAALDHPNILPVLRVGMIEDGRSYLVMKYAAQGSLQQFCQPAQPAISLLPTSTPTPVPIAATPGDALLIAASETVSIAEVIEEQNAAQDSAEGGEQTVRRESLPEPLGAREEREEERTPIEAELAEPTAEPPAGETSPTNGHGAQEETLAEEAPTLPALAVDEAPAQEANVEAQAGSEEVEPANAEAKTQALTPAEAGSQDEAIPAEQLAETLRAQVALSVLVEEAVPPVEEAASASSERDPAEDVQAQPEDANGAASQQEAEQIATRILTPDAPAKESVGFLPSQIPGGPIILSPQQVLRYLEEAAEALHYAHQRGLIHLDVKPANLLLDAQGRLMLADFGVSVLLEGYTHASLHYYVGTPLYTAPEQWLEQPRPASDQYALAVTCYQLLTGRPPFIGNLYAVMHGHLQAPPPPMSAFNPLIPPSIEAVIQRALAKDPEARYPSILDFARAYREALESAASATTDGKMVQRVTHLLEQRATQVLPQAGDVQALPTPDHEEISADEAHSSQAGTFKESEQEGEIPGARLRPNSKRWLRNLLLLVLVVLLIGGGSLGFVRTVRPCWLGICAQIALSTNAINFTNDASEAIKLTNTGTDDLHWQSQLNPAHSWLSLSPASGTLAPGEARLLTVKTNVDHLSLSGQYTGSIEISGGPGVVPQRVAVTETVAKGLELVSVKTSGKSFLYEQGHLQPGKQTITITNNSGQTLNWYTAYTDNNWLSVTPSQGSLANKQTKTLTATVTNPQLLANDTYQVRFSLMGKLDNQDDFQLLQTIDFSLQVHQTIPVTPTVTQPGLATSPLSFTAQPVQAPGAPGVARSNHSMIWDSQDDQLLVFGGIDPQGNLLNDLWSYSPASNRWTNLTPSNPTSSASDCSGNSPAPRMNAAMVWDDVDHEALLFGGEGNNGSFLNDLWAYAQGSWTALSCAVNGPVGRGGAGVAWTGSQMFILDGLGSGGALSDFWAYTPGSGGGWTRLAANTPLGARIYPAMAWDSQDKQLYVFGGLRASQQLGDFYVYHPGGTWNAVISSNNTAPLARQQALCTWDSHDGVFLLMGGWQTNNSTTFSAMWAYSPRQNAWWQITSLQSSSSTSVIPSRLASVMVWDSTDSRAYVYAGAGGPNKTAFSDLWMIMPG